MKRENGFYVVVLLASVLGMSGCQSENSGDAERSEGTAEESPAGRAPAGGVDGPVGEAGPDRAESPLVRAPAGGVDASVDEAGPVVSAGKPAAPIDIRYSVIGSASVGQPVNIEIDVRSTLTDAPITLDYRINDPRELTFDEAQPQRVELRTASDAGAAAMRRQVTVIPQREGRVYLNVSASIETEDGSMIRSIAIPVQVGRSRSEPAVNGELKQDADGETVISMPAEEN